MDQFFNNEQDEVGTDEHIDMLSLSPREAADITSRFSGLKIYDNQPKAIMSYSTYDYNASDEDADKRAIYLTEGVRFELSIDHMTGFYLLDAIFDNADNYSLKLLWARLQKHKLNETYAGDRTWIFYIKLVQNLSEEEEAEASTIFTANIMNPLAYYLIRRVPNEDVEDMEPETGVFCGGNTVRMLLHPQLVSFQYEELSQLPLT